MRGVEKFWFGFDELSHRGGKQFSFPLPKGWKIVIVTSALESQRRVRCEFGDVGF